MGRTSCVLPLTRQFLLNMNQELERTNHLSHWEPYRDQDPNEALNDEWNQMMREEQSREELETYNREQDYD
jgi:hypothetical protein